MDIKRNGALGFWKFVFCMIIVVHYAYFFNPLKADSSSFFFYRGEIAFDFFFLLTGMMLAESVNNIPEGRVFVPQDEWSLIKSLIRRYLPALMLCWAATFAVINVIVWVDGKTLANNFFASLLELLPLHSAGFTILPPDPSVLTGYRVMDQAWVFSAVILALAVLYPLYRANRRRFEYYIAPVGGALILCFVFFRTHVLTGDNLTVLDAKNPYLFFFPMGTYKAFGEILAGVSCYVIVRSVRDKKLSKAKTHLLSLVEIGGYLIAIAYMQFMLRFEIPKRYDFLAAGFILLSLSVTLSEKSSLNRLLDNKFFRFLGRFSLYPFLTFILFAKALPHFLPDMGLRKLTLIYVSLTLVSALVLMALEKPFVRLIKAAKKLFVKPAPPIGKETVS